VPPPAAAQAPLAEVRAAVELANSAEVWGAALRLGDPTPLAAAWTDDPLAYFSGEVLAYRARGLRLLSTLLELEFLDVRLLADDRAVAETRERWLDRMCTDEGELRGERWAEVEDHYELVWHDGQWRVAGLDIALTAGSFDWQPAMDPPDGPSPCAAVVGPADSAADGSGAPR
jgi:hypothetical protein